MKNPGCESRLRIGLNCIVKDHLLKVYNENAFSAINKRYKFVSEEPFSSPTPAHMHINTRVCVRMCALYNGLRLISPVPSTGQFYDLQSFYYAQSSGIYT